MAEVLAVGSCRVETTGLGFLVTREGEPVPARVHPPALLTFASKTHARMYAKAISEDRAADAHELISKHGRWWACGPGSEGDS